MLRLRVEVARQGETQRQRKTLGKDEIVPIKQLEKASATYTASAAKPSAVAAVLVAFDISWRESSSLWIYDLRFCFQFFVFTSMMISLRLSPFLLTHPLA
jgi:hypothetical protein